MNWSDDIVEFQHEELALAIYGALVQAQIKKLRGTAQSNVATFPGRAWPLLTSIGVEMRGRQSAALPLTGK